MTVRVRVAPSPTGHLHVGTARVALFNFLFARKNQGKYILRLEDTDKERNKQEFEEEIYESLNWLGLSPDEGPQQGGPYAPYRDSERTKEHHEALHKLLNEGKAFYCPHKSDDNDYSIHWCEFREGGSDHGIIRFKTPRGREIHFDDLIRGGVTINTDTLGGDFSIGRSLDSALYNFAVTVDDEMMKITHVIRGEDHITNTPKQILLQEALGYTHPQYGHLPLLLGTDRSKLSKRHGATAVIEFRNQGYLPEALINFLALLGWNPGTDQEVFSTEELIQQFSVEKIQKSGAIFDTTKLDWMNGEYIRKMSIRELIEKLLPFIQEADIPYQSVSQEKLEQIITLEQPRLKRLAEIGERIRFFFQEPQYDKELLRWKDMTDEELIESLGQAKKIISDLQTSLIREDVEQAFLSKIGERDKGKILWPLRVALTGLKASPGPFDVVAVLGRDEAILRLERAEAMLANK